MHQLPVEIRIPRDATLLGIVDEYRGLKDQVPCGLCGTVHGKGVVVCFAVEGEQQNGIMGHICGKKYFGEGFSTIELAWRQTKRKVEIQAMIDRFETRASRIDPEVRAVRDQLKRIANVGYVIENAAPQVFREVSRAINGHSGILMEGTMPLFVVKGREFWTGFTGNRKATAILRDITTTRLALAAPVFNKKRVERALSETIDLERRWTEVQTLISDAQIALEPVHLHGLFGALNKLRAAKPEAWDHDDGLSWRENKWFLPIRMNKGIFERVRPGGFGWEPIMNLANGI